MLCNVVQRQARSRCVLRILNGSIASKDSQSKSRQYTSFRLGSARFELWDGFIMERQTSELSLPLVHIHCTIYSIGKYV